MCRSCLSPLIHSNNHFKFKELLMGISKRLLTEDDLPRHDEDERAQQAQDEQEEEQMRKEMEKTRKKSRSRKNTRTRKGRS